MKKSVFVTGATQGTGFAIAERFAKEGYDVFIGSRNVESSQKAAETLMESASARVRVSASARNFFICFSSLFFVLVFLFKNILNRVITSLPPFPTIFAQDTGAKVMLMVPVVVTTPSANWGTLDIIR